MVKAYFHVTLNYSLPVQYELACGVLAAEEEAALSCERDLSWLALEKGASKKAED